MTQASEKQGSMNGNHPVADGLRRLNVRGWSFARIHQALGEMRSRGWTLSHADTSGGFLVLYLRNEAAEARG